MPPVSGLAFQWMSKWEWVCEHVLGTLCLVKTGSISYYVSDHCSFSGSMTENCIIHEEWGHVSPISLTDLVLYESSEVPSLWQDNFYSESLRA